MKPLPRLLTFGSNTIEIEYGGGGNKLRKTVKQGSTTLYIQNYLGGIEYNSGHLEAVFHAEGRVYNTNVGTGNTTPAFRYEYAIRDHLGNTRILFTDKNNNGVLNVTAGTDNEIIQENQYYPFGMNQEGAWMNDAAARDTKYQYNGKELNDDFGLNWSDYGARWYDASIGRWNGVDPLAEKMSAWSTYNYAFDNPIRFIDPDGMAPLGDIYNLNGVHIGNDGVEDNKVYVAKTTDDTQLTQEESANVISRANLELYGQSVSSVVQLSVTHDQFRDLAGTLYAEGSNTWEESAAIYSVIENRAAQKDKSEYEIASSSTEGIYGWKARDRIDSERGELGHAEREKNSYKGLVRGMVEGTDYSGGAYFWHGRDFRKPTKGSRAHEDYYLIGFRFNDTKHDIWGLGNHSSGRNDYQHKYESTNAEGQTTFMKLTNQWRQLKGYRKNY